MRVRELNKGEEPVLWELFYGTIHNVNIQDYSPTQIEAWAPADFDVEVWKKKIHSISPFIVEADGRIVGYSDLRADGFIDHFYVHHEWQRNGVGTVLMSEIERRAKESEMEILEAHVSITARGFFEGFQFTVESEQNIEVRGESIPNFIMRRRMPLT